MYRFMDCSSKLNHVIYCDSEIVRNVSCARTKTEAILNNVLAPHFVTMAIYDSNEISCLGVSTDVSSYGSQKLFAAVKECFNKVHGIKSKLTHLTGALNANSDTIANCVTQTLKDYGLLTKCVDFSYDNTNTSFGKINRSGSKNVFHALKHEVQKELAAFGCPPHAFHKCIQLGEDTSVEMECTIMKIYSYFHIYRCKNRKSQEVLWIR
jgi:hypothetical protein